MARLQITLLRVYVGPISHIVLGYDAILFLVVFIRLHLVLSLSDHGVNGLLALHHHAIASCGRARVAHLVEHGMRIFVFVTILNVDVSA